MAPNSPKPVDELKKLYRDKNGKARLCSFVEALSDAEVDSMLDKNLVSSEGANVLDALILGSCSNGPRGQNRRFKIVQKVLKKLQSSQTPPILVQSLLTSVLLELPHHSSENIVKVVEECIDTIRNESDAHTSWKDLIPECLRSLSNRGGTLNHYDTTLSTSEFITRAVHSLCQVKWNDSVVIPLAAMFNEIQLSKEEHLQIVNKLCCDLDGLNPDSLPPLIHQLLRFCKDQNSAVVYFRINDYFYSRLYKSLKNANPQDSESPIDFDSIDDYSDDDVQKAEATCIYYACRGGNAFKKFLATSKILAKRPASLLGAPTLMQILLAAEQQKETCIQILRSCLNNFYFEELRRSNFTWCKDILTVDINLKTLMNTLIDNSAKHCHITGEGLLMLAMSLITTGGLFPTAVKLQELGLYVLIKFLKKKPEAMHQALKTIKDKLGTESVNIQPVAEALRLLCVTIPHGVMEYTSILQAVLEDCLVLPEGRNWTEHKHVIESMNTIIRLDSRLRDTLIMVCRKGLFSRDSRVSRIAVHGFLSIIKNLNTTAESFSQEHSNPYSVLSQISLSVYSAHSAPGSRVMDGTICMEVLSLLRRCFSQSYDVREQLYLGLPSAIRRKPELLDPVLNILYEHLTSHYYVSDIEALPPLMLNNCATLKDDVSPTSQEPLGRLIFTIQTLLICEPGGDGPGGWSLSGDPERFTGTAGKLYGILLSLANRMAKCTTAHFNLEDGISPTDIDVDSQLKCLVLQQTLSCYEALIAFRINEWTPTKTDQAQKLLNLQKNYSQLLEFTKFNSSKSKKDSNKKTQKNKENEPEDIDDEPPKKKAKGKKGVLKLSDMAKNKSTGFKLSPTVWDFYTLSRALELLYGKSVKWSTTDQLNAVRTKRELHRIVVKFGIGVTAACKSEKLTKHDRSNIFKCAMYLFDGCLSRMDDFVDFDSETAILTVECFHDILKLIVNHSSSYLSEFLSTVGNIEESKPLHEKLTTITEILMTQFEMLAVNVPLTEDPTMPKIVPILFQLVATLLHQLPAEAESCEKWVHNLEKLTSKSCPTMGPLGTAITSTVLDVVAKSSDPWIVCDRIVKKLSSILGTSSEEETPAASENFEIITLGTAPSTFVALCSYVNTRLAGVETVTGRVRADQQYLQYRKADQLVTAQATLKNRERSLCSELCQIATATRQLAVVACPAGPCTDSIIHLISRLHSILAMLTSHFLARDQRALQSARFDKLVKSCGKHMSEAMDTLITHVEKAREGGTASAKTASAKAKAQRALKDTKRVPRLVYNSELFYKRVHQLDARLKIDLVQYLSKGNARDFRITAAAVKDVLQQPEAVEVDEESSVAEIEEDELERIIEQGDSEASETDNDDAENTE